MQFEQLVKDRIAQHEFHPICIQVSAKKARKRLASHLRYEKLKNDPEFRAKRKEQRRKSRQKPEYKARHAAEERRWRAKQPTEWKAKEIQRLKTYLANKENAK